MARSLGWAKCGEWCKVSIPFGRCRSIMLFAAMIRKGMIRPLMQDDLLNGHVFLFRLTKILVKELSWSDVVICDNVVVH